jgi:hypothetical protein
MQQMPVNGNCNPRFILEAEKPEAVDFLLKILVKKIGSLRPFYLTRKFDNRSH